MNFSARTAPKDVRYTMGMISGLCVGCDSPLPVNDLGLCESCFDKLERDLIRARDWAYSVTALGVEPDQREALRQQVIRDYGAPYELIVPPGAPLKPTRKNKRSHSRESQRQRDIAAHAQRNYTTDEVLQAIRDFLHQQNEVWVDFSRVAQYLHERFYNLKPKRLGGTGKKYTSLLEFVVDHPSDFTLRRDDEERSVYWICLGRL